MQTKKDIVFFIRAYNDLDSRLSTILFLASKKNINLKVFFYPTNNSFFNFNNYEIINLLKKKNIKLIKFYKYISNFFFIYYFYFEISFFFKKKIFYKIRLIKYIFNKLDKILLGVINFDNEKLKNILNNNFYILDDIIINKYRSKFILSLEKINCHKKIFAILTGQDTYIDLYKNPNFKKSVNQKNNRELIVNNFFVPSKNDKSILKKRLIKSRLTILGNARFEPKWINYLNNISNTKSIPLISKYNLTLMLSKLEYGVNLDELRKTIDHILKIKDLNLIIKPHTRGMSLDDLIKNKNYNNLFNGEYYNSSTLIKWSTHVLFTGSSIIFQAMALNKKCIFLKNCLNVKSIFDYQEAVFTLNRICEIEPILKSKRINNLEIKSFLRKNVYNNKNGNLINRSFLNYLN
jgi:hypothetical protein